MNSYLSRYRWIVLMLFTLNAGVYSHLSWGEVPVVDDSIRMQSEGSSKSSPSMEYEDASTEEEGSGAEVSSESSPHVQSFSLEQRVTRLEKQMMAKNQVDNAAQLDEMRDDIAELRGQVEALSHQAQQTTTKPATGAAVVAAAPTSVAMSDPKELQAYQVGYDAIKKKDYDRAKTGFLDYLDQYGKGEYASNAHYWLGEIYLQQGSLEKALVEFNKVTMNPKTQKYPEAMLKIGFIYYQQSNWAQARKQLMAVKQQFPDTTVASLASARLQEMIQQGH